MTKMYYNDEIDCMCIVENGKIYKYLGDDTVSHLKRILPVNEWYEATNPPKKKYGFVFIGKWK